MHMHMHMHMHMAMAMAMQGFRVRGTERQNAYPGHWGSSGHLLQGRLESIRARTLIVALYGTRVEHTAPRVEHAP